MIHRADSPGDLLDQQTDMFTEATSLEGLVGIITGAGRGIGRAYCQAFAKAGAVLVVAEIDPETGKRTADEIRNAGGEALFVETDVRKKLSVEAMVQRALETYGHIDFLINNAGLARESPATEISEADWRDIIDVNLSGTFFCCQAVGRHMIENGGGSIVNIASISGLVANRGRMHVSYNVAKAGVVNLTKMLACEWAEHGIRVNGIAPGYVASEKIKPVLEDPSFGPEVFRWTPMGRAGRPEEIAPLAMFLVSAASSFMTGTTVVIDGGFTSW